MTRRPLCMLCLILMLSMCATDWAGFLLYRGILFRKMRLLDRGASQAHLCGEVTQTTENEFSQSVYLSNAYLIYQSQKLSIENVKVFLKQREDVPAGLLFWYPESWKEWRKAKSRRIRQPAVLCQPAYLLFAKQCRIVRKIRKLFGIQAGISQLRSTCRSPWKIAGKEAGIFQAIVLGDKTSLDEEVKLRYQMAGIVHILAISDCTSV